MLINVFSGAEVFAFTAGINVRVGRGACAGITEELARLGGKRPFVVADPGVHEAGLTRSILEALDAGCETVE